MKFEKYLGPEAEAKMQEIKTKEKVKYNEYKSPKKAILGYINDNPGCTAKEVARGLNYPESRISTLLWNFGKSNIVRRIMQDGKYRHYPANYLTPNHTIVSPRLVVEPTPATTTVTTGEGRFWDISAIENAAYKYVWYNPAGDLRGFIAELENLLQ